jgi:pimeloyl-ACP methyl ester carboxylesterase
MKRIFLKLFAFLIVMYVAICTMLFFLQEKLIFHPQKLSSGYTFSFDQKFTELNIVTSNKKLLNAILFEADSSKGLIFYLHGNSGALDTWGGVAKTYTDFNYDVFIPDYPGYGKSEGYINSQQELLRDIQIAYDEMKKRYKENKIIVLGYSLGTGLAAEIASTNNPELLYCRLLIIVLPI